MKHFFFIVLYFLFIFNLYGQDTTYPIFSSSNVWTQYSYYWPNTYTPSRYSFSEDSISLGQYYYKSLSVSYDSTGNNWIELDEYYRQSDGQVYTYNTNGDDFLQMDFDLMVGDTFRTELFLDDIVYYLVKSQDSIELQDGSMKKRLGLSCYYDPENILDYWIEDVGSTAGGIHNTTEFACAVDIAFYLSCFHSDETLLYDNNLSWIDDCWQSTPTGTSTKNYTLPDFEIYPNPASSILNIKCANDIGHFKYTIYNILGENVQSSPLSYTIDITTLQQGAYNIVISNNSNLKVFKFIKK